LICSVDAEVIVDIVGESLQGRLLANLGESLGLFVILSWKNNF